MHKCIPVVNEYLQGTASEYAAEVGCKEVLISKNIPALQISMRTSVLVLRALSCCENVKKETVFLCSIFGSSSYTETQVIKGSSRSGQRFSLLWD